MQIIIDRLKSSGINLNISEANFRKVKGTTMALDLTMNPCSKKNCRSGLLFFESDGSLRILDSILRTVYENNFENISSFNKYICALFPKGLIDLSMTLSREDLEEALNFYLENHAAHLTESSPKYEQFNYFEKFPRPTRRRINLSDITKLNQEELQQNVHEKVGSWTATCLILQPPIYMPRNLDSESRSSRACIYLTDNEDVQFVSIYPKSTQDAVTKLSDLLPIRKEEQSAFPLIPETPNKAQFSLHLKHILSRLNRLLDDGHPTF